MTRKEQIQTIRKHLLAAVAVGTGISREIQSLAWASGRPPGLPVTRDGQGHRTSGKRALKPYRRPETGPQRYTLWNEKRSAGEISRYLGLALGFLRGRPYLTIEKTTDTPVSGSYLHRVLVHHLPGEEISREDIDRWLAGEAIQSLRTGQSVERVTDPQPRSSTNRERAA